MPALQQIGRIIVGLEGPKDFPPGAFVINFSGSGGAAAIYAFPPSPRLWRTGSAFQPFIIFFSEEIYMSCESPFSSPFSGFGASGTRIYAFGERRQFAGAVRELVPALR